MSEKKDLKERFGHLGIYLVERAQEDIKNLNQQILFQKAEIKKRYRERTEERSQKLRNQFINDYNQKLNDKLTESVLYSKDKVLKLKNDLINQLNERLLNKIKSNIKSNYSEYLDYILTNIKKIQKILGQISRPIIILNSQDYEFFKENEVDIKSSLENQIEIQKAKNEILGGFFIKSEEYDISYNYTFDELIKRNLSLIEKQFNEIISEEQVKNLQNRFEKLIDDHKQTIEEYLIEYERI
ncbi:MAG: hypothetical protein EU549_04135 [Promethearchaeota archaeon]|nr:MAG: hypothetical protein EU549_04135 [Candidatus Lokiarchaeota archaeon]